ncbi:MAG TPA: C-terminal helicase domain-containing protein, partial [Anaerolineaceae bacterium]
VHFVAVILERYGYNAAEISSDLSQAAREDVMEKIRQGTLRFLVATDVASRGIDIPELSHVILYEVPDDPESYIHRAGRTGRAGASGVAISVVNALERAELMRIAKRFSINMEDRPLPTDEDVQGIIAERTAALLESRLRERDRLQTERMQRFLPFLRSLNEDEEAMAGAAMLLDDFYHQNFHTAQTPQPEGKPLQERIAPHGEPASTSRRKRRGQGHGAAHEPGSRQAGEATSANVEHSPAASELDSTSPERTGRPRRRRRRGGRGQPSPAA